ncbi:MAG: SxtJ family membrane protein [Candidatus Zixiibacteriota bacterium]
MLAKTNWRPGKAEIRYFANTLAVLAIILGVVLAFMGKANSGLLVGIAGLILAVACRLIPIFGRWIFIIWTAVTFILSFVFSPIVIAIIYYVVLTPIAFFARLFGKDELRRKRRSDAVSYFEKAEYDTSPESFRRQF